MNECSHLWFIFIILELYGNSGLELSKYICSIAFKSNILDIFVWSVFSLKWDYSQSLLFSHLCSELEEIKRYLDISLLIFNEVT